MKEHTADESRRVCQDAFQNLAIGIDCHSDQKSFEALFDILVQGTGILQAFLEEHPETAKTIARRRRTLPVLVSPHREDVDKAWELVNRVELGHDTVYKRTLGKKSWSPSTRSVVAVRHYYLRVEYYRTSPFNDFGGVFAAINKLKPLNEENIGEWFSVLWDFVMHDTCDCPEDQRWGLRELGDHKKNHSLAIEDIRKARPAPKKSAEANIRAGIREAMRLAFFRIMKTKTPKD